MTVGGAICGNIAIGRVKSARPPARVITIERTEAKIGRSMKKRVNTVLARLGFLEIEITAGDGFGPRVGAAADRAEGLGRGRAFAAGSPAGAGDGSGSAASGGLPRAGGPAAGLDGRVRPRDRRPALTRSGSR